MQANFKLLEKHGVLTSLNDRFESGFSCETQLLVTLHDFMNDCVAGLQSNIVILDFFPKLMTLYCMITTIGNS